MAGLGYKPFGGSSPNYRSGIRLKRDRALAEFLTSTGQPTPFLAQATNNLGFSGPLGCGRIDVTFTQGQITTMNATPVLVLPAVTGQTYVLEGPLFMRYTAVGGGYTGPGNFFLQYHQGAIACTNNLAVGQMGAASTENIVNALPSGAVNVTPVMGDQIEATTSAGFTGGTGTLRVTGTYLIF